MALEGIFDGVGMLVEEAEDALIERKVKNPLSHVLHTLLS